MVLHPLFLPLGTENVPLQGEHRLVEGLQILGGRAKPLEEVVPLSPEIRVRHPLHYWLRPIKGVHFRFANFASHFIRVQIFQIDFPLIL